MKKLSQMRIKDQDFFFDFGQRSLGVQYLTVFSQKLLSHLKPIVRRKLKLEWEQTLYINDLGHMTKMSAMFIYG